jgi:membrane protein YfhO
MDMKRPPPWSAREIWMFLALAAIPIIFLFHEAVTRGFVLGQATLVYQYLPWSAHRPAEIRADNRLLFDVPTAFYPVLKHVRETVLQGHLPTWMAAAGSGMPLLAGFQSAVLSPLTWPLYLSPFPQGLVGCAIARMLVGGLGMFVFLRTTSLGRQASLFGAMAFMLNSFSIVWLEHPPSAAAAWLPWLLVGVDACLRRRDGPSIAVFGLVTTCTLVAGHPETAFELFLLAGGYALYRAIQLRAGFGAVAALAAGGALGLLGASLQILPFLEYVRESRVLHLRSGSDGTLITNPPAAIVAAFVPDFYGNPLRHRWVLEGTNYGEQQVYAGVVTWLAAAMGVMSARYRSLYGFFASAAVVALLLMYGSPLATMAARLIPPMAVMALSRFGLLVLGAVSILAAIGVEEWLSVRKPRERMRLFAAALVGVLAMAAIVGYFIQTQYPLLQHQGQWRLTQAAVMQAALLAGAALLVFAVAPSAGPAVASSCAIALVMLELLRFATGLHPLQPRDQSFPMLPEIQRIQQDSGLFRVTGWVDTLLPNTATVYGLHDVRLYDGMTIARYADFLDLTLRPSGTTHQLVSIAAPQLLDFLNLKYIVTPADVDLPAPRFELILNGPVRVYTNRNVMPRANLVGRYVVAAGDAAKRLLRRGEVDLTQTVVLERQVDASDEPASDGQPGEARIERYDDDHVRIVTVCERPRLLVLADPSYPGWAALVDGKPVQIYRANIGFRAVSVPAGRHVVEFNYRPLSVRMGFAGSLVGLLGLAAMSLRGRTQRRFNPAHRSSN